MRNIILVALAATVGFIAGCGSGEDHSDEVAKRPSAHSSAEYRALLEKRASSVDGAKFDIRREVGKYENASEPEKIELYERVEKLVK